MIDTGLIRKNILDLAIRGALTPNNLAEKKPTIPFVEDDVIQENDKLFNIPDNWAWSKIGWIMDIKRGGSPRPIKAFLTNAEDGVNWIKIGDVEKNGKYILQTKEKIKPEGERKSRRVFPGDFLLTNSMSFGRPYISQIEGCVHDGWLILRNTYDLFYYDYLYYMLSSKYMFDQFSKKATGSTVDNLNIDKVASAVVPVPPIEEQIRTVKKVEEIINLLNTIDELQAAYSSDLEVLKSKVIDAGIQGKLTEQLLEDGNAEDLYDAIQEEKEKLIKEKKLKKAKALPEIAEDEIPFEIPENWKWVRIGELFTLQAGKNMPAGSIKESPDDVNIYPCYGGNGLRGYVSNSNVSGKHAIIGRQGALCGNINFAEADFYATEHAVVVYQYADVNVDWIGITLRALNLNQYATSVAQPGLAVSRIDKVLIPLPPLAEQERIVEKVLAIESMI